MKGLYEKRGWYYYWPPTEKGQPRPKSMALGTKDYLEAVTRAIAMRDATEVQRSSQRQTLAEILPIYYKEKLVHTKDTRHSRERILKGFQDILGNPRVDKIDEEAIDVWWQHLASKGGTLAGKKPIKPASKKSYLIVVRAFLNWCKAEKMLKGDPLKRLKGQTKLQQTRIQDFLTEDERERILASAHDQTNNVKLILHLGFFAGMRDGEMLAMKKDWIWISPDGDRGSISIQNTPLTFQDGTHGEWTAKGKRTRVIPMHPRLLAFLLQYGYHEPFMLAPHKDRWPNDDKKSRRYDAKKALNALGKKAEASKLNYHILRHSFAIHLVMKGVALAQVAGLLGDGITVTENHYAGFSSSKINPLAVL